MKGLCITGREDAVDTEYDVSFVQALIVHQKHSADRNEEPVAQLFEIGRFITEMATQKRRLDH